MIWPGGEVELAHRVALWCVGLEEYTLKKKKTQNQNQNKIKKKKQTTKTGFRGATVGLPAVDTGQSSASLKMPVTKRAVI